MMPRPQRTHCDTDEVRRCVIEAFSARLRMGQVLETMTDPSGAAQVRAWHNEAEAEYESIRIARQRGDDDQVGEHHQKIMALDHQTASLQRRTLAARKRAGTLVLGFAVLSIALIAGYLWKLNEHNLAAEVIPVIGVPYAVVFWSAIGSLAAMLYQFLHRPVSQLETIKWLVARPIQGLIMGSFLYLVVAGGILIGGTGTGPAVTIGRAVSPPLAAVIAFLGGFSGRFADEMVKRATSIFSQGSRDEPPKTKTDNQT